MKLLLSLNEKDVDKDKDIDEDVDMDLEKDKFKGRLPAENVVPKIITTRKISTHFCRKDITIQRRIVLIVLLGVMTFSYSVYLMFSSAHVDRNVENGDDIANNEEDEYNKIIQTWSDIWDTADLRVPTSLSLDLDDDDDDLLTMDVQQLFRTFPSPTSTDTMKIYNKKAYLDLIKIFLQHQERNHTPITLTFNGGSSTAGGGHVPQKHRYHEKFVDFAHELNLTASAEVDSLQGRKHFDIISRGHGNRHSLHSAVFASNFLPPVTDILFWEFATNDFNAIRHREPHNYIAQMRSTMIAWLQEVQKIQPKPPKVVLIYLWSTPFKQKQDGNVKNPVFDAHKFGTELAAQFDFVVGHVNVASYFDELTTIPTPSPGSGIIPKNKIISFQDVKGLFLADKHHPNSLGHLVVSFLLLNFVHGKGEWFNFSSSSTSSSTSSPMSMSMSMSIGSGSVQAKSRLDHNSSVQHMRYEWFCGNKTFDSKFIKDRVVDESDIVVGWRSPLATLTLEEPQNQYDINSTLLKLVIDSKLSDDGVTILGKQDPLRIDRVRSVALPCCSRLISFLTYPQHQNQSFTDVRISKVNRHSTRMDNVRAMFLGFAPRKSNIDKLKIFKESLGDEDGRRTPVSGKLIKVPQELPCHWTWDAVYSSYWFAFSEKEDPLRDFTSLSICVENSQCESSDDRRSGVMLISVALYS